MTINLDAIPAEMKAAPRWIVWRFVDGRKVSFNFRTGKGANPTSPSTWGTFADVVTASPHYDGIGFVLGDGWAGVDFDDCIVDGTIAPWVQDLIDQFASYAEISPSGKGVKIFMRGRLSAEKPEQGKRCGVEVYDRDRYFAVTGRQLPGRAEISEQTARLAILHLIVYSNNIRDIAKLHNMLIRDEGANVLIRCPWSASHSTPTADRDAALQVEHDQVVGFHCFHAGCVDKTLGDIKKFFGVRTPKPDGIPADRVDPEMVDRVWERVVEHNDPATLFRRQQRIVLPIAEEIVSTFDRLFARQLKLQTKQAYDDLQGAHFAEVSIELFTEILARTVGFFRMVGKGEDKHSEPAYPTAQLVRQVMASPVCPLPIARGLIRTPSFDANGTLIRVPGYHPESGIFYAPPPGFALPDVPTHPTAVDVQRALDLWNGLIGDFPFVDDAGKAHILALPLTILAREMIRRSVPMCLVDKPETGTGATLMLQVIGWVVLGEELPESTWSTDEEEQRKYLTTLLMRGRPLVNLDNITYLDSKDLLSVISGGVREDRRLGGNELLTIPNRAAFVGSGINVNYNEEHAGRLYVVRLDAKAENPRLRDVTFKHPDLMAWTREHRPALVAALLTLIQSWIVAGRPAYPGKRLAGFEEWSNVIGGVLAHAGVPGFLDNRDTIINRARSSADEDIEFASEWLACLRAEPPELNGAVRTKELFTKLPMVLPTPRSGQTPTSKALGRYLASNVDKVRVLDDGTAVAIRRAPEDKHGKQQRWTLDVLTEGQPTRVSPEGVLRGLPF